MTDQQALAQYAQRRDAEAFRHLVNVYAGLVYSAARRRLANDHDIDDVVQMTFLKLARSSQRIREDLGSWLYATSLNTATDLVRQDQTRRRHEALVPPALPPAPDDLSEALDREEWQKLSPLIDDAILALPPAERSLIIQHFFQNRSQRELADALNVSHTTVQRRLNAAIESLRQSLRAAGNPPAAPALIGTLHALSNSPVPAPLTAQLTKIGIAGTGGTTKTAIAAKSTPWLTRKALLAGAIPLVGAMAFVAFEVQKSMNPKPPAALPVAAAPSLAMSPAADLSPFSSTPDAYGFKTDDAYPTDSFNKPENFNRPSMIFDKNGTLYIADGDSSPHGIVRAKLAGQDQWATIFEAPIMLNSLARAPNGDLFVGAYNLTLGGPWPLYRQPAGQMGFQDAASDPLQMSKIAIAVAKDGSIFAAGETGTPNIRWIVRKQTGGTGDFFTVDDFALDRTLPDLIPLPGRDHEFELRAMAFGMIIVPGKGPSAGVYVVGRSSLGDIERRHWIVRRSKNDGQSWTTVDDFASVTEPKFNFLAAATCADPAGNVYVAGGTGTWTIRRSPTGDPGTWSTIDQYDSSTGGTTACWSITADAAGNVYAAGTSYDLQGAHNHAVIRTNTGGTWHTIEDYCPPQGDAYFNSIVFDPSGRIYAAGLATIAGSQYRIVRSAPPPVTLNKNQITQTPNAH